MKKLILFILFAVFVFSILILNLTGKVKYFVVLTDSMAPVITPNTIVFTKSTDFYNLQEGDIISFYTDIDLDGKKEVVIHYFDSYEYNENETFVRTKRYNAESLDSWKININNYIGKSFFYIPKLGKIIRYFTSIIGILNLIFILFVFFLIDFIIKSENNKHLPLFQNKRILI